MNVGFAVISVTAELDLKQLARAAVAAFGGTAELASPATPEAVELLSRVSRAELQAMTG